MINRLLLVASVVLLGSCDGGEPDAGKANRGTTTGDAAPVSNTTSGSSNADIPVRPQHSARLKAEMPIDERGGFDLVGPVRRMTRSEAGYSMTKEGYEQDEPVMREVLVFDEHGQLLSCRTDRGPSTIERDEQGRLVRLFMDTGSQAMKETTIITFTSGGHREEFLVLDASNVPLSRTLFMRDRSGRIQEERLSHWGLMDSSYTVKWEHDDQGRPDAKSRVSRGKLDSSTSITYGYEFGAVEKEKIRDRDGNWLSTTQVTRDEAGNWTRRHETRHIYDPQGLITDRPELLEIRTIDYFESADGAGTVGSGDKETE